MPMLSIVTHLTLIDTYRLATKIAIFSKHVIKAAETIRLSLTHNVPLTAQLLIAVKACKVLHMPSSSLRFRAFIRKNNLIGERKGKNLC